MNISYLYVRKYICLVYSTVCEYYYITGKVRLQSFFAHSVEFDTGLAIRKLTRGEITAMESDSDLLLVK